MTATKTCSKCHIVRPITEFCKNQAARDKLSCVCRGCTRQYTSDNKKKLNAYMAQYHQTHTEEDHNYYLRNKDRLLAYSRQWYQANKAIVRNNQKAYENTKYKTDVIFRIKKNLRTRLGQALKNNRRTKHTCELTMCTIPELKVYIEQLWTSGMSWDNYGFGVDKWNIDHIIPCSFFNLADPVEQYMCFRYQNLQPLWQPDNFAKRDNYQIAI